MRKRRPHNTGIAYVETLVAFPVVVYFTMVMVQLVDYMLATMLVKHAAIAAARAAAVIGPDDPQYYGGQALNELGGGQRLGEVRKAVQLALQAKAQFQDDSFTLTIDGSTLPYEMINARLSVDYKCLASSLNAVCGFQSSRTITASGVFPYQAASVIR